VDWKAKAWLDARIGDVSLRWTARHVAAYRHDSDAEPGIDAQTTYDATAVWTLAGGSVAVDATVVNITGEPPPRVYRQINYDPLTHDPLGRIVQLGVRWQP